MIIPNTWENKKMFQTTNQVHIMCAYIYYVYICVYIYICIYTLHCVTTGPCKCNLITLGFQAIPPEKS